MHSLNLIHFSFIRVLVHIVEFMIICYDPWAGSIRRIRCYYLASMGISTVTMASGRNFHELTLLCCMVILCCWHQRGWYLIRISQYQSVKYLEILNELHMIHKRVHAVMCYTKSNFGQWLYFRLKALSQRLSGSVCGWMVKPKLYLHFFICNIFVDKLYGLMI